MVGSRRNFRASRLDGSRAGGKVERMISIRNMFGAAFGSPLELGARLPDLSQINQDGERVDLTAAGAGCFLLVFFYPKAGTPLCTKEACGLRDAFDDLTSRSVRVIGVSADGLEAQQAFHGKFALPYDLLADEDGSVRRAFGVPRLLGITFRQSFLFKDGSLIWRDQAASPDRQAADVLKAIAALPGSGTVETSP